MSNEVKEFEVRTMICERDYHLIMDYYLKQNPNSKIIINDNFYIDSPSNILASHRSTLRLRIINADKYEFTLKIKQANGSLEINDELIESDAKSILDKCLIPNGKVKKCLIDLPEDISNYRILASLRNERLEIKENDHELVIDKNVYGNIIDYNLEVESTDLIKAKFYLDFYCAKFNIKASNDMYRGKAWRAINGCKKS